MASGICSLLSSAFVQRGQEKERRGGWLCKRCGPLDPRGGLVHWSDGEVMSADNG